MHRGHQRLDLKRISGSAEFAIVISETRNVAPSALPPGNRAGRDGCYREGVALRIAQDVPAKFRLHHPHRIEPRGVLDGNPIRQVGETCEIHVRPSHLEANTGFCIHERRPPYFQPAVQVLRQPNAHTDSGGVVQIVLFQGRDNVLTPAIPWRCAVPYPPCFPRTVCGAVDPLRLDEWLAAAAETPVAAKLRAAFRLPRSWSATPCVVDSASTRAKGQAFQAAVHPVFDLATALASRFHWHGHIAPVLLGKQHRPFEHTTPQFGLFQPCRFLMVFSMIPSRDQANKGRRISLRFLVTDLEPYPPKEPCSRCEKPHHRDAWDSRCDGRLRRHPDTKGDTAVGVVGQVADRSLRASAASSRIARI